MCEILVCVIMIFNPHFVYEKEPDTMHTGDLSPQGRGLIQVEHFSLLDFSYFCRVLSRFSSYITEGNFLFNTVISFRFVKGRG